MYKIIGADGKEYGPITADQLRQWVAEGRANSQTRILLEGTSEWKPLSEFPEFAAPPSGAPPAFPIPATTAAGAAEQVNGPALALIIFAVLGFLLQATSLLFRLVGTSLLAANRLPNQAWLSMFSGTMGILFSVVGILVSGLILYGGLNMRKLENYGLVMAASVLAMIPCLSPCCLLGLPIGIWALVVLAKPEIKGAFH
jgi:hypothetical protein